jgi:hypothetical protein
MAFRDSIAVFLPATQSIEMTNEDNIYATNIRIEQLELAYQRKGTRLSHVERAIYQLKEGMVAIELRIVDCIPDNLAEQLAARQIK